MLKSELTHAMRGRARTYTPVKAKLTSQRSVMGTSRGAISWLSLEVALPAVQQAITVPIARIQFNYVSMETPMINMLIIVG